MSFIIRIKNRTDDAATASIGFRTREDAEEAHLATDWVAAMLEVVEDPDVPAGDAWSETQREAVRSEYASYSESDRQKLRQQMMAQPE